MQLLPTKFKKQGFDYEQIERNALTAIYSQNLDGEIRAYEVVRITVAPAGEIMGNPVVEREMLPGNEQWGIRGWTYWDLEKARARARELEERMLEDL
jgi:hypothetical protein